MYRRILVPVDGSATSKLGLRHALGLAQDQHARIRVLNVLDELVIVPMMDGYPAADNASLIESMRLTGEKALGYARALAAKAGIPADTVLVESRGRTVSDAILDAAHAFRADLIVMGTHGRRGFNRLILGSDAERVLREAPVPVLLVRGEHAPRIRASKRAANVRGSSASPSGKTRAARRAQAHAHPT
jgi:nucleotide-binding universal stress UspA family protein